MTDDKRLKHIESEYGSGRMLTGEAKAELIKVLECSPESSMYRPCCKQHGTIAFMWPKSGYLHLSCCNAARQPLIERHTIVKYLLLT